MATGRRTRDGGESTYMISPRVEGEQLTIDPLLVLIAVLAGEE